MTARIRHASTEAIQKEPVVVEKDAQATKQQPDQETLLTTEQKPKIKLGEVRRLMQLAKPEKKTIGIAVGLVSNMSATTSST